MKTRIYRVSIIYIHTHSIFILCYAQWQLYINTNNIPYDSPTIMHQYAKELITEFALSSCSNYFIRAVQNLIFWTVTSISGQQPLISLKSELWLINSTHIETNYLPIWGARNIPWLFLQLEQAAS